MGDEAFQTKKNEPTHISLRCLEQAVCCIMYCNSGPNFPRSPADVTSDDAECAKAPVTVWKCGLIIKQQLKLVSASERAALLGHITLKPR